MKAPPASVCVSFDETATGAGRDLYHFRQGINQLHALEDLIAGYRWPHRRLLQLWRALAAHWIGR